MIFASQYEENLYVLECSAQEVSYHTTWEPVFRSIADSVQFRDAVHPNVNGEYRDFTQDKRLKLYGNSPIDHYYY